MGESVALSQGQGWDGGHAQLDTCPLWVGK